jgi:hypothetical protein
MVDNKIFQNTNVRIIIITLISGIMIGTLFAFLQVQSVDELMETYKATVQDPMQLSIEFTLNKTQYAKTEPIPFVVKLTNIGNTTLTITRLTRPFDFYWVIFNINNFTTYQFEGGHLQATEDFVLNPNDHLEKQYTWHQKKLDHQKASSGVYRIHVVEIFLIGSKQYSMSINLLFRILI